MNLQAFINYDYCARDSVHEKPFRFMSVHVGNHAHKRGDVPVTNNNMVQ